MICSQYSSWSVPSTVHDLLPAGQIDPLICYDLPHASGWEPYDLHDVHDSGHVSWVGSVLLTDTSCTSPQNSMIRSRWSTVDRDLSDVSDLSVEPVIYITSMVLLLILTVGVYDHIQAGSSTKPQTPSASNVDAVYERWGPNFFRTCSMCLCPACYECFFCFLLFFSPDIWVFIFFWEIWVLRDPTFHAK